MMKPDRQVLEQAATLLEHEGSWCQHSAAKNSVGLYTDPVDVEAVAWCAKGAIWHVQGLATSTSSVEASPEEMELDEQAERLFRAISKAIDAIWQYRDGQSDEAVAIFNDENGRLQSEVVLAVKAGIDYL